MSHCKAGLYPAVNLVERFLQPLLAGFYHCKERIENAVVPIKRCSAHLMVVTRKLLNMLEQLPHRVAEPHYHIDRLCIAQFQHWNVQSELRCGSHSREVKGHAIRWDLSKILQRAGRLFDHADGKLAICSDRDSYFDRGCSLIAVVRLLDVDGNARRRNDSDERSCCLNPSGEITAFLKVKCDGLALVDHGEGTVDRVEQCHRCDENTEKNKQELEGEFHGMGWCVWERKSYPDIGCDV